MDSKICRCVDCIYLLQFGDVISYCDILEVELYSLDFVCPFFCSDNSID